MLWRVRKEKKKQRVIPARYTPYLHFDISPHAYQGSCGSPHSGKEVQRNRRVAQQGTHIRAKNKKGQQKSNTSNEVGSSADAPCAWKVGGGNQKEGKVCFQVLQVHACSPLKSPPPPKDTCTHSPFQIQYLNVYKIQRWGGSGRWIVKLMSLFEASVTLVN